MIIIDVLFKTGDIWGICVCMFVQSVSFKSKCNLFVFFVIKTVRKRKSGGDMEAEEVGIWYGRRQAKSKGKTNFAPRPETWPEGADTHHPPPRKNWFDNYE